jgi:hypothetical protein
MFKACAWRLLALVVAVLVAGTTAKELRRA